MAPEPTALLTHYDPDRNLLFRLVTETQLSSPHNQPYSISRKVVTKLIISRTTTTTSATTEEAGTSGVISVPRARRYVDVDGKVKEGNREPVELELNFGIEKSGSRFARTDFAEVVGGSFVVFCAAKM